MRPTDAADARGGHAADPPGAAPALISFDRIGHTYRSLFGRPVRAVDDFTLEIGGSEVFGLAGPNGAGKSTLISLLLGFIEPTEGTVRIAGLRPREFVERHGIGYLSELIAVPPRWKVDDALIRYGLLAGLRESQLHARIEAVIGMLGLEEHRDKRVKQLSKGNLQRLGLAQALLREERVVILDEPTHGLDPVWTQRFRDVVEALRRPGRVIFIASHNLDELQRLADRVAIIDRGRLQRIVEPRGGADATTEASRYLLTVIGDPAAVLEIFPHGRLVAEHEFELTSDLATLNAGMRALIDRGLFIGSVRPVHSLLERHFREAVGE